MIPRIYTFKDYCRRKYGQPVGKIALDAGLICPNRRLGGCIYCAAESFTPFYLQKGDAISVQVAKGREFLKKKGFVRYFAYFQQETTTAAATDDLLAMFDEAISDPACVGLIVSTRPDYVEKQLFAQLKPLVVDRGKDVLVELGLQSAHDATLRFLNRNHTFDDFVEAVRLVRGFDFIELGVHLILGLPGESYRDMLATVKKIGELGIDYIKFHHLQVIRGTRLHEMYEQEPFELYSPPEYLQLLASLLTHVEQRVVIHRLWSTAAPDLLVGPRWDLPSSRLNNLLGAIMNEQALYQGKNASS